MCLFDIQTKNILNTLNDDYSCVLNPKFDIRNPVLFQPHKLGAPRFIFGGRSIVNVGIQRQKWQKYRECLDKIDRTTTKSILDIVRDKANVKNRSALQEFIGAVDKFHRLNLLHHLSPDKFVKYLMDCNLIIVESDFLYYDVNCQSQLLAMFMRTKGKDKSQGVAVPDSEAMKTFNDTMNMIQDTRINQSQVREHMTSLL